MLAAELRLAGIDVAIVERRTNPTLAGSRADGLQARTLEVLDQRSIVERFLAGRKPMPTGMLADAIWSRGREVTSISEARARWAL